MNPSTFPLRREERLPRSPSLFPTFTIRHNTASPRGLCGPRGLFIFSQSCSQLGVLLGFTWLSSGFSGIFQCLHLGPSITSVVFGIGTPSGSMIEPLSISRMLRLHPSLHGHLHGVFGLVTYSPLWLAGFFYPTKTQTLPTCHQPLEGAAAALCCFLRSKRLVHMSCACHPCGRGNVMPDAMLLLCIYWGYLHSPWSNAGRHPTTI